MLRWLPGLLLLLLLTGCNTTGLGMKGSGALSFLNTYDAALADFERGRIMEARNRILAMDKNREDYPQAKKLLKDKVEPARLRLLRHYVDKAKSAERGKQWDQAMTFYGHASELSIEPEFLKNKRTEMEMAMRQLRLDRLLQQRRSEDAVLVKWLGSYDAPRGVAPQDKAFAQMRELVQDIIEERADDAYAAARRYLRKDEMVEVAYIEAETFLRLMPDSERAKRLMEDVKEVFPSALRIPKAGASSVTVRRPQGNVTAKEIYAAMEKGDWAKARELARIYRREGGKDADRLLKKAQSGAENAAASYFQRGRIAFQQERLDEAVSHWEKAVRLTPDNNEYVDALRRAKQLQERLRVLREGSK